MPGNPNDFAEHAKNLLAKQSKPKIAKPMPSAIGETRAPSIPIASAQPAKQFFHPQVYKHISMHIAERLKKLAGG